MADFAPAVNVLSGGLGLLKYWWVLAIVAVLCFIAAIIWWFSKYRQKNSQWTHKLITRIELPNGEIDTKETVIRMRRWKHKDEITAPLFELEKPLLGSRIFVELEEYSDPTSYTIVLGKDGRIYIPTKTVLSKDKKALEISVKHAAIDRARQNYSNRFEQMNATPSKIDVLTLMKYGIYITILIVILILGITALKTWGERSSFEAQKEQLELQTWNKMADVMETVESVLNTQALIIPDLKNKYGNNLQSAIQNSKKIGD